MTSVAVRQKAAGFVAGGHVADITDVCRGFVVSSGLDRYWVSLLFDLDLAAPTAFTCTCPAGTGVRCSHVVAAELVVSAELAPA